jgi:anti-sigma factor (TIGR02949 family)
MGERMDCREAAKQLQDYLKRELTPELESEVRAHLDSCRHCHCHAQFEENFLRMLRAQRGECCPGTLRARIVALLRGNLEQG